MRDSIRPPVQGRSCWHRVPATLRLTTAKKPTRRRSATCPETSGMWSVGDGNDRNRPIHDDSGKKLLLGVSLAITGNHIVVTRIFRSVASLTRRKCVTILRCWGCPPYCQRCRRPRGLNFPVFLEKAVTMKYLLPTVAGCASVALVGTLAVTAPTAFAATSSPDVSKESLKVSEEGLNAPGARDSSDSTATAAHQSATSNLPNIFKSETALAKANAPDIVNASASATTGAVENVSAGLSSGPDDAESSAESTPSESEQAAAEDEKSDEQKSEDTEKSEDEGEKDSSEKSDSKDDEDISGSVRQKTEDGVNIALISDVLDVPSNNPSLIGFTFSETKSNIRIQVRVKHGSEWGSWDTLDQEQQEEAQNKGSEPMTVS